MAVLYASTPRSAARSESSSQFELSAVTARASAVALRMTNRSAVSQMVPLMPRK
jgi:hypothetical protein